VGKTRLAREIAHVADNPTVLLLAPLTDPAAVPYALATAMDLAVRRGDVLAACLTVLGERPALLVVDNCEHLLDAARELVQALLASCPRVAVLATSRAPLGLAAERVFRLAPLAVPAAGADPTRSPAVAVFLDRARRVRPSLAETVELGLVVDIVRRLDGMPLALELAAGRLSGFSLADLHARLDRALDLLGGPRPAADSRHRTLRDTLEWSYRLLAADEQRLFRHLAVFVDGVNLDTAERLATDLGVAGDPAGVLARLVDASMIEVTFRGGTRYSMLETLRAFGLDRLAAAGEAEAAARWLVRWAVELGRWFEAAVATDREPQADAVLRRELANLRVAWRTARERGLVDDAAALVASLFDAVMSRDLVEVRAWARELADDPAVRGRPDAAAVFAGAAYAAYAAGDQDRADALARAGLAEGGAGVPHCRHALAVVALARGAYVEVVEHCLAHDAVGAVRHGFFGLAALACAYAGDVERARELNGRWTAVASAPSHRAWAAYYDGEIENTAGRRGRAEQHYLRAVALGRSSGDTFVVAVATVGLLSVLPRDGRAQEALTGYREVIDYFARTGTGPTNGPPCAISRSCCAPWATPNPPRCSRAQPTPPRTHRRARADPLPPPTAQFPIEPPSSSSRDRRSTAISASMHGRMIPSIRSDRSSPCAIGTASPHRERSAGLLEVGRDGWSGPHRDGMTGALDKPLLPHPRRVAVLAEFGEEPGGLGRLRRERADLASRGPRIQVQVDRHPVSGCGDRVAGQVDAEAFVEPRPAGHVPFGDGRVQQPCAGRGHPVEGRRGPRRDGLVVGMTGDPVGAEGEHGVRADLLDQRTQLVHGPLLVGCGATAVGVATNLGVGPPAGVLAHRWRCSIDRPHRAQRGARCVPSPLAARSRRHRA
jgi:predicted ATPase